MCPSGDDAFARKAAQKEQQKAQGGSDGPRINYLTLAPNTFAVVRFLEQGNDLTFADVHRFPRFTQGGKRYFVNVICANTNDDNSPCPLCQHTEPDIAKRQTRGYVNLIWREGPVYEKNEYGSPKKGPDGQKILVGRQDVIALWDCSWTNFEILKTLDVESKGLMLRDWKITRIGSGTDTKYQVAPAQFDGGPQPMLLPDITLAESKYNLVELTTPKSYQDIAQMLQAPAPAGGPQPTMDRSALMPTAETAFAPGQTPAVHSSAFTRG